MWGEMAEPELAEQFCAIERAQERARLAGARAARRNGAALVLVGMFMGGWALQLGFGPPPPVVDLPFLACWLAFILLWPRLRGTSRRHWRRASLVAIIAGAVFEGLAMVISLMQVQFGLRIVGSAPSFWITDGVLTALPAVIVGLWEARPRRAGPSMPEVAGVG